STNRNFASSIGKNMSTFSLAGRVVVITGSTGGLGSALAAKLKASGARLALFDLDLNTVEKQVQALGGANRARGWRVDVRSYEDIRLAMDEAAEHFGRIDVVIANAGIEVVAPMEKTDPKTFDRVIDINLNGVWRTFRAGLPHVQRDKGYLLAISSLAAFFHSPLQASYTASKAGVWALCNSIRMEVKHLGVGVGSVHPTFFNTAMLANMHADPAGLKLWDGNRSLFFKSITLEMVVDGIHRGIERRSEMVVIPSSNSLPVRAPGIFRGVIEKFGFKQKNIIESIDLASYQ
ncbi:SDR family NAD(P)-dependent oxidoreductase, partial [Pseudomonas aeruginosa]|uniref:SDR family NAD(P)-dependent oxidoreductase n=1 Tax=Pseudomonas aeruginosa TaxID=287 RepID=UPI00211717FE